MMQQPNLFPPDEPASSPLSPNPRPRPLTGGHKQTPRQVPVWLLYFELAVRVLVRIYLGLVLVALPWTTYWSSNHLLLLVPHLVPLALNGATRGIVSGLGFLNIWIGMQDIWIAIRSSIHSRKSGVK